MHLAPRVGVFVAGVGTEQELPADLHRFFCKRAGEFVVVDADICFNRMRQHVHAGVRRDLRGNTLDHFHVQNRFVRGHIRLAQRDFDVGLRVRDDGKGGNFTAGAAGGRNTDQARAEGGVNLPGKFADGFGKVDCRTAADRDNAVRHGGNCRADAVNDLAERRVRNDILVNGIRDLCPFQLVRDQADQTAADHKRIRNHQNARRLQCGKAGEGIVSEIDFCSDLKIFHMLHFLRRSCAGFRNMSLPRKNRGMQNIPYLPLYHFFRALSIPFAAKK